MAAFEPFFFYTNQRALKRFLVDYKICSSACREEQNITLSDDGEENLLFWKNEVNIDTLKSFCKTETNDIVVALKVYLPTTLADTADEYGIVRTQKAIPFFNVSNVYFVDKPLQFLQGDTTLIIPRHLICPTPYAPQNPLAIELTEQAISRHLHRFDNSQIGLDDEFEDESIESALDETEFKERKTIDKKNRYIAAYLTFIQGKIPFDGSLSPRLYYALVNNDISFSEFIANNVYSSVPTDIVKKYCEKLCQQERAYLSALKNSEAQNIDRIVYSAAIKTLTQLSCAQQDKSRFLELFFAEIRDDVLKNTIAEIFADKRARSRIVSLQKEFASLVPIYFLYTFWDYRYDRFCENLAEFGLSSFGVENITLSLWALLHGMEDVYSEYKNLDLLFAINQLTSDFDAKSECLPYDAFAKINAIKLTQNLRVTTIGCNYVNYEIEYHACVDDAVATIDKILDELKSAVLQTFDFQYVSLRKNVLQTKSDNVSGETILRNKITIHKKFVDIAQRKTNCAPKKKSKSKRTQSVQKQLSFFDDKEE